MRSRATSASLQETVKMFGDVKELRMLHAFVSLDLVYSVAIPSSEGMSVTATGTVLAKGLLRSVSAGTDSANLILRISLNAMNRRTAAPWQNAEANLATVKTTCVSFSATLLLIASLEVSTVLVFRDISASAHHLFAS